MRVGILYLGLIILASLADAGNSNGQLPASQKLSPEDLKGMTGEVNRWKGLLLSANDRCFIEFQMARTYAAGGQYAESFNWLRKVVDSNCGLDPMRERLFGPMHIAREFQALVSNFEVETPRVSHSHLLLTIPDTNLFPENFAYDPIAKNFYFGSTLRDEIVRCQANGQCQIFVPPHGNGLGYVLGLKFISVAKRFG